MNSAKESFIPFARPDIGNAEIEAVARTLRSGWVTTGPETRAFEQEFAAYLGGGVQAVAVNSATAGLHLALEAAGIGAALWTWRDSAGAFLQALTVEDRMMFILMSILVLIAAMNIISGLVMLVKNKGRDIGILRHWGADTREISRAYAQVLRRSLLWALAVGIVVSLVATTLAMGPVGGLTATGLNVALLLILF